MKGKYTPSDYDRLREVDEMINERSQTSGFHRWAKQFGTKEADMKRNSDYCKYFNTHELNSPNK